MDKHKLMNVMDGWGNGDNTIDKERAIDCILPYIVECENAILSERDHWKSKFIQQNKDLDCELMDPNGTIWDHAKKLQEENERLREALKTIFEQVDIVPTSSILKIVNVALERKST